MLTEILDSRLSFFRSDLQAPFKSLNPIYYYITGKLFVRASVCYVLLSGGSVRLREST